MRLEAITLHGFKSFSEKTTVKVLPGITAIVGPNGCGKSNISEAVRWALGEQSAKSLRGQRMEDLIFHGSASRKPVGLAEVELTFANDGTLSVPWSEIGVARRLYRTGESEYLLNRQPARLRDILDLFAGTGANPRAYSVMDQDKLNHVLTAKPHERRVFIEEAAGIARYKQQRNETQGKLDGARQNLVRVRDVMDEVRRQLGSLERQARKAQQYKALQTEKRELGLALMAADFAALTTRNDALAAQLTRLRDAEQGARARLTGLAAREAAAARAPPGERAPPERSAAVRAEDPGRARAAARASRADGRAAARAGRGGASPGGRGLHRDRAAGHHRRRAARPRARRWPRPSAPAPSGARAVLALEAETERHRAGLAGERDRLEALRLEQMRVAAERVDLMREAGELRERQVQLARRGRATGAGAGRGRGARPSGSRRRGSRWRRRASAPCPRWPSLAAEREQLVADARRSGEPPVDRRGHAGRRRALDLAARSSSRDALRELELAREGYGAGVRAVFAGAAEQPGGIVGTVADLLEVEPGLERAVEAVLGERLQWVVVERFEHARAAVAWLHERTSGSATFLPLERLGGGRRPARPTPSGDFRWARESRRRSHAGALAVPAGPGGHRRSSRSGRGAVAPQRRGRDVRHAGR